MNYLVDTNVISEGMRRQPERRVAGWLTAAEEDRIYISVIVLAELRLGVQKMPAGRRRDRLEEWITAELPQRFEKRILAIDESAADAWGRLFAQRLDLGKPISAMDAFLAALAQVHGMILVTRNTKDFSGLGLELINPWEA